MFSKIDEYIKETRDYVLPLVRKGKGQWSQYSREFNFLEYHIEVIIEELTRGRG